MWQVCDSCFWYFPKIPIKSKTPVKILGLDFDHTCVLEKSGNKFAQNSDDWIPIYDDELMEKKLNEYSDYQLVIFTNQGGIHKKKKSPQEVQKRITNFLNHFGLLDKTFVFMASRMDDHFRKPCDGMWKLLESTMPIDYKSSIFVGDGAGRVKNWKTGMKKDFSCSDRKFAYNIGITFKTPEEFWLDEKECPESKINWDTFDFDMSDFTQKNNPYQTIANEIKSQKQTVVILIAPPASGKTTFTKKYFPDFNHINRDTLKTMNKCLKVMEANLKTGTSIVVDNTNPSAAKRSSFLKLAKKYDCNTVAIWWNVSKEFANHMNNVRVQCSQSKRIPMVAFHIWYKNFEKPTTKEGFSQIFETSFYFDSNDPILHKYIKCKF